ncbi:hypothetical protein RY831_04505 [Noviherbaspirillum sp. CPCC 100848]|uniref:Uncharacterized protein n=1 Tax=Noviherbaspirillum album TaxID=3080276 RepID=A0ABU6J5A5_9BURK|nr:hypothetical protein [Noviherbaspirillum sp. CPCC 100848]MEC4718394.1 hypothetical protein [Noviherbaspirillum sp. CPCC 100848]
MSKTRRQRDKTLKRKESAQLRAARKAVKRGTPGAQEKLDRLVESREFKHNEDLLLGKVTNPW